MAEDQKPTTLETVSLETRAEHLEHQINEVIKDRDEWRQIAKEATKNVKLITDQGSAPKNNDNIAIIAAGTFALGLFVTAIYFMTQQNEPVTITPEPVTETQPKTSEPITSPEQLAEDAGIDFSNAAHLSQLRPDDPVLHCAQGHRIVRAAVRLTGISVGCDGVTEYFAKPGTDWPHGRLQPFR